MVIEYIIIIVWFASQLYFGYWLYKIRPRKEIINKYSKSTVFKSSLPFASKWRSQMDQKDLPAFERYRKRLFIQYFGTFLLPIIGFYLYLYLRYR